MLELSQYNFTMHVLVFFCILLRVYKNTVMVMTTTTKNGSTTSDVKFGL